MNIFLILTILALLTTFGVLFAGVLGMGKDGIEGSRKSNKMMRARIISQAMTVIFALLWIATS